MMQKICRRKLRLGRSALLRGMDMTRKTSKLKFNPIKFHSYGINGSAGKKSSEEFFRSILSQNMCYCVRNIAKTVNEIADDPIFLCNIYFEIDHKVTKILDEVAVLHRVGFF